MPRQWVTTPLSVGCEKTGSGVRNTGKVLRGIPAPTAIGSAERTIVCSDNNHRSVRCDGRASTLTRQRLRRRLGYVVVEPVRAIVDTVGGRGNCGQSVGCA